MSIIDEFNRKLEVQQREHEDQVSALSDESRLSEERLATEYRQQLEREIVNRETMDIPHKFTLGHYQAKIGERLTAS